MIKLVSEGAIAGGGMSLPPTILLLRKSKALPLAHKHRNTLRLPRYAYAFKH